MSDQWQIVRVDVESPNSATVVAQWGNTLSRTYYCVERNLLHRLLGVPLDVLVNRRIPKFQKQLTRMNQKEQSIEHIKTKVSRLVHHHN